MKTDKKRLRYTGVVSSAVIAAGTILIGYADLWRGGLTVSAVFLTVGYLVCVPIAVMAVPVRK